MPGFQSTRLATEGALEPFLFLYTDDSIQGNPETCNQSSMMLNYEVKNIWADYNSDCAFTNQIVVQPFEDGTFRYLSNSIEQKELDLPPIARTYP